MTEKKFSWYNTNNRMVNYVRRNRVAQALEELKEAEVWDVHVQQAIHILEDLLDN